MLHLFFAVISAAAPLTLYVTPMRNLNLFVETMEILFRPAISYMLRLLPRLRRAIAHSLSPELWASGRLENRTANLIFGCLVLYYDLRIVCYVELENININEIKKIKFILQLFVLERFAKQPIQEKASPVT